LAKGFISEQYIQLGNFDQAEAYVRKNQALIQEARGWSRSGYLRARWEAEVERGKARLFEARGRFREAEASYRRSETLMREALRGAATLESLLLVVGALLGMRSASGNDHRRTAFRTRQRIAAHSDGSVWFR
jgi:tetratricopeptide (TPR) repeat protein